MSDAQEAPRVSVQALCDTLDRFIESNSHSMDDSVRWLADFLKETLQTVRRVRTGNLQGDDKKLVASFRLAELQKQKTEAQRTIENLDRQAKLIERELAH